jgi:hypothetical protein
MKTNFKTGENMKNAQCIFMGVLSALIVSIVILLTLGGDFTVYAVFAFMGAFWLAVGFALVFPEVFFLGFFFNDIDSEHKALIQIDDEKYLIKKD